MKTDDRELEIATRRDATIPSPRSWSRNGRRGWTTSTTRSLSLYDRGMSTRELQGKARECFVIGEPAADRERCRRLDRHRADCRALPPENADERHLPVEDRPRVAGELAVRWAVRSVARDA